MTTPCEGTSAENSPEDVPQQAVLAQAVDDGPPGGKQRFAHLGVGGLHGIVLIHARRATAAQASAAKHRFQLFTLIETSNAGAAAGDLWR
jgi:hypothetical protein